MHNNIQSEYLGIQDKLFKGIYVSSWQQHKMYVTVVR